MDDFEQELARMMRDTRVYTPFDPEQRVRLQAGVRSRRRARTGLMGGAFLALTGLGVALPAAFAQDRIVPAVPASTGGSPAPSAGPSPTPSESSAVPVPSPTASAPVPSPSLHPSPAPSRLVVLPRPSGPAPHPMVTSSPDPSSSAPLPSPTATWTG